MTLQTLRVPERTPLAPRIMVFGLGGAGCNAVNNLIARDLDNIEYVVANTDSQSLTASACDNRIQLGLTTTDGLGAGADPQKGRAAAEESIEEIRDAVDGVHLCFVTAGMGGGTGTGAAPVVAKVTREAGVLTVAVVIKPFKFEGDIRMAVANTGITELENEVNTLIVIPNQNLFDIATEAMTSNEALGMANDVLYEAVKTITDLMSHTGQINRDFADVRTVFSSPGRAMFGFGESEGEHRGTKAAEAAMNNKLLEDMTLNQCERVLINVLGGTDMKLWDIYDAAEAVHNQVGKDKNIIVGSASDGKFDGRVRVSVIATGMNPPSPAAHGASSYTLDHRVGYGEHEGHTPSGIHRDQYDQGGHSQEMDKAGGMWPDSHAAYTDDTIDDQQPMIDLTNGEDIDLPPMHDEGPISSFVAPGSRNRETKSARPDRGHQQHDPDRQVKPAGNQSSLGTVGSNVRQLLENLRGDEQKGRSQGTPKPVIRRQEHQDKVNGDASIYRKFLN